MTVFLMLALMVSAEDLTVGTFNIRMCANNEDVKHHDDWNSRYKQLCAFLNFESPDLFGSQEVYHSQLMDMLSQMPEYAYIGVGREDGKEGGEYSPIFYKKDRFKLLDSGHFWLAPDPSKPALGWDAVCIRICTWGYFKDLKTKHKFYFFNTHMDHIGVTARREGARLIMKKMKELMKKGETVIMTGDFNVDQKSEAYKEFVKSGFLKDCYESARYRFAENGTFQNFNINSFTTSRIDHIFVSSSMKVERYGIHTDGYWIKKDSQQTYQGANSPKEIGFKNYEQHTLSDHYPVLAKIDF